MLATYKAWKDRAGLGKVKHGSGTGRALPVGWQPTGLGGKDLVGRHVCWQPTGVRRVGQGWTRSSIGRALSVGW